jgi:CheY-like chemotaxis protein
VFSRTSACTVLSFAGSGSYGGRLPSVWSFFCSLFSKAPELKVNCEVSDGLEAVRKAEELQPDLILLDIGLPSLNGIEAARQCSQLTTRTDSGRRVRSGVTSRKAMLLLAFS